MRWLQGQAHIGRRVLCHDLAHDAVQGGDGMDVQVTVQMQASTLAQLRKGGGKGIYLRFKLMPNG